MSWAFSKSLPDNQEGLGFSFLYPWRSPFELSHSKLDIPVPDHTTFWTDGCITLVQIKKNLKVVKKRLEDCMLKKIRAWVERNLPTNTHTVSWQSHWLFYQNSNVPAYIFTVFVPPVMAAVPLKCTRGVSPLKTARPFWLRKRHRSDSIVSLSPPRYQGKKEVKAGIFSLAFAIDATDNSGQRGYILWQTGIWPQVSFSKNQPTMTYFWVMIRGQ